MRRVTSLEILKTTGIQSIKTLTRWHQRGLIPEPTIGTHPNGHGKIAYWPEWVLGRCQRIRDLAAARMRLDEIANTIGCDWKAEEVTYRERYRLRTVSRRLNYEAAVRNFVDLASQDMVRILVHKGQKVKKVIRQLDEILFDDETVAVVVDYLREGRNPILVYDGQNFEIVPEFEAAQLLTDSAANGQVYVMKSISKEAKLAFSKLLKDEPNQKKGH